MVVRQLVFDRNVFDTPLWYTGSMRKIFAGSIVALALIFEILYLLLSSLTGTDVFEQVSNSAFILFALVGAILAARHPRNPVGLLVAVLGLAMLGGASLFEYSTLSIYPGAESFPYTDTAAFINMHFWPLVLPCLVMILLLFPDGHLPGPRWRWLVYFIGAVTLPLMLAPSLIAWPYRHLLARMNLGLIPYNEPLQKLMTVFSVWNLVMIGALILAVASFLIRFSRSLGIERQQMKWFVFGISTIPASMLLDILTDVVDTSLLMPVSDVLGIVSVAAFPVVLLIAMTRYRLYDIDFIIRRTLLYSTLTITLAAIYFATVLLMQSVFTRGMEEPSEIFVVFSTLLIAALFQPLRRRFQTLIDKRFYRSKYDAEETLAQFAARLQNEVDLDEIQRTFVRMVDENIQPEGTALWLVKR